MCCGSGTYRRSRNTGRGISVPRAQFKRTGKYKRFIKKGKIPMAENPEVEAVPVIYKAEEVTPPKYEDCDPSTGMSLSVLKTGIEPSNVIPQPLPEALNPVEVDANKSATGEGEKTGTVTQAGGGS